jgi:hypothetical protein
MRILFCCLVLFCTGCHSRPSQEELYGEYEARASNGILKMVLNRDLTYEETALLSDGTMKHLTGQWIYSSTRGRLSFQRTFETEEGKDFKSDYITGKINAAADLPVSRYLGKICIDLDPNTDFCYNKVKSR